MIEASHWHPVASSAALGEQPLAARLLGVDLVLWRDAGANVHAWADQCPHRGARLSLGRVLRAQIGDRLECPYHGWQFDSQGLAQTVPALPNFRPPKTHQVQQFAVTEQYGLIWVQLASQGFGAPPKFDAEHEVRLRKVNSGPYDVQTSAPRIVENFLDLAHFGFVHEHWLGARERPEIGDYKVVPTDSGFIATGCRAWQPHSSVNARSGAMVEYTYEVTAPFASVLTKQPEPGTAAIADFRESIALFVCPIDAEFSRVWFRMAMNDFISPDQKFIAFQDTIFMQDKPVLESQRPKRLPLSQDAELHCAADKSSAAYRRLLREWKISFGVC